MLRAAMWRAGAARAAGPGAVRGVAAPALGSVSPLLPVRQGGAAPGPVERRARAERRLSSLLAVLSDGGLERPSPALEEPESAGRTPRARTAAVSGRTCRSVRRNVAVGGRYGAAMARLLDRVCPEEATVLHDLVVPGTSLPVEHLVVAPRGLVVVGPWLVPPGAGDRVEATVAALQCHAEVTTGVPGRSEAVRAALRRATGLRAWLRDSHPGTVEVMAAVCSAPAPAAPLPPAVVVDGLWCGPVERLPAWLGAGGSLGSAERVRLGALMVRELAG